MATDPLWNRWDEIDPLLERLLDLPASDREAFLDEACAGDDVLAAALRRLVGFAESQSSTLARPGSDLVRQALSDPSRRPIDIAASAQARLGRSVGPYRLERVLGLGGMGVVYLAVRDDGLFDRQVAIKILHLDLDTPGVVERFRLERQILAGLNHPSIAQMIDGGVTDEGRPYLVMEYVDGTPIGRYANERRMSISDRIWLILAVTEAVEYAHRHMVVHRDLKPSNILVTDDGRVKLLDFGVAKLLEPSKTAEDGHGEPTTRFETRFVTPEYAAPEQIRFEPVTTATDVHAVGILLYELLTGQRPFGRSTSTPFELQQAVLDEVPPPVSSALIAHPITPESQEDAALLRDTTPRGLQRSLSGDLDAILSKALRKQPDERYRSVEEFRADLRRHLTGHPVQAREGLRLYRARKFVRRHWFPVSAGLTTVLVLAGFVVGLARANARTVVERDRAETEAANAQAVVGFLSDVFRGRDPSQAPSDTITARGLLEWGAERLETEFADRPALQADLYTVLASSYSNLGLLDEGVTLLERAEATATAIHGEDSEEVADILRSLGRLHRTGREFAVALPYLERAVEIYRGAGGPVDARFGGLLVELGGTLRDLGQPDSAEVLLRNALRLAQEDPDQGDLATHAALGLAYVLRVQEEFTEADALYREAIPEARASSDFSVADLATHLNNHGFLKRTLGDHEGARALYAEALELWEGPYGRGHPQSLLIAQNLASVLHLLDRPDEVVDLLRRSVSAAEAQWPEGHWRVGAAHLALGRALLRAGHAEDAKGPIRESVRSYTETLGPDHNWTYFATATYRVAQILTDEADEGHAALDSFIGVLSDTHRREGGVLSPELLELVEPLVAVLRETGLTDYAERFEALLPDGG